MAGWTSRSLFAARLGKQAFFSRGKFEVYFFGLTQIVQKIANYMSCCELSLHVSMYI